MLDVKDELFLLYILSKLLKLLDTVVVPDNRLQMELHVD